jgi:hypothetical protein
MVVAAMNGSSNNSISISRAKNRSVLAQASPGRLGPALLYLGQTLHLNASQTLKT